MDVLQVKISPLKFVDYECSSHRVMYLTLIYLKQASVVISVESVVHSGIIIWRKMTDFWGGFIILVHTWICKYVINCILWSQEECSTTVGPMSIYN